MEGRGKSGWRLGVAGATVGGEQRSISPEMLRRWDRRRSWRDNDGTGENADVVEGDWTLAIVKREVAGKTGRTETARAKR